MERTRGNPAAEMPETTGIYSRPRLDGKIGERLAAPLVVVAAPAGYGKTVAVADFLHRLVKKGRGLVGWLTLNELDNGLSRFWRRVGERVAACGLDAAPIMDCPGELSDAGMAADFLECTAAVGAEAPFYLVLDDYHLLQGGTIDRWLERVARAAPPGVRVLALSRTLPDISLSALALQRRVAVVSQEDLRFTREETEAWARSIGLALSPRQLDELNRRTDGWISGLYLSTLPLAEDTEDAGYAGHAEDNGEKGGAQSPTGSILGFEGADMHNLLDCEIFARYDAHVRRFLLDICCLEEHDVDTCAAVSGSQDALSLISRAARTNLFIRPDIGRRRYRIHHIFRDFLRERAEIEAPGTGCWRAAS